MPSNQVENKSSTTRRQVALAATQNTKQVPERQFLSSMFWPIVEYIFPSKQISAIRTLTTEPVPVNRRFSQLKNPCKISHIQKTVRITHNA
jgi:hypothetical protein